MSSMSIKWNDGSQFLFLPLRPLLKRLLDRMVNWILRPIDFPGKWPVIAPPADGRLAAERYNKEVPHEPTRPDGE
jgi:hypothetical protein